MWFRHRLLIPVQDIVEKQGVEILSQHDKEGHSPIHWAALGGHTHVLRYFVDKKVGTCFMLFYPKISRLI